MISLVFIIGQELQIDPGYWLETGLWKRNVTLIEKLVQMRCVCLPDLGVMLVIFTPQSEVKYNCKLIEERREVDSLPSLGVNTLQDGLEQNK